jgi:hypothetical protein
MTVLNTLADACDMMLRSLNADEQEIGAKNALNRPAEYKWSNGVALGRNGEAM